MNLLLFRQRGGANWFHWARRRPLIVGTVVDREGLRKVRAAAVPSWDVVELRLDRLGVGRDIFKFACDLERRGFPVIATIRMAREGGYWREGDGQRTKIWARWCAAVSAIDVELKSEIFDRVACLAHIAGTYVVGSFHDFVRTPELRFLIQLCRDGVRRGADIVKIATRVRSPRDVEILSDVLRECAHMRVAVVTMGRRAPYWRAILARQGSFMTYGAITAAAAPGQPSCAWLRKQIRSV